MGPLISTNVSCTCAQVFWDIARCFNTINVLQSPHIPLSERRWGMGVSFASNILPQSPPLSPQLQQISIYFIDAESMRRMTNCILKICGKLLLIHSSICHDKPFLNESYSSRCYNTADEHSQSHACIVCFKMSNVKIKNLVEVWFPFVCSVILENGNDWMKYESKSTPNNCSVACPFCYMQGNPRR